MLLTNWCFYQINSITKIKFKLSTKLTIAHFGFVILYKNCQNKNITKIFDLPQWKNPNQVNLVSEAAQFLGNSPDPVY